MVLLTLRLAVCLFFVLANFAARPAAAEQSIFSPWTQARLADAARRGDDPTYNAMVVAEIARNPKDVARIVTEAIKLAPHFGLLITAAAKNAFPGFASQIARAGTASENFTAARRRRPPKSPQPQELTPETQPTKKIGWAGKIDVGGSRSTGNTEREQFSGAFKLTKTYPVWKYKANMSYDFARDNQKISARRLVTNLETRYDPSNGFYAFGFVQYEDDKFSGFDFELTESAGAGRRIFHNKALTWSLEIGPGGRQSAISDTNKTKTELVGRGKSAFLWNLSDTAKFTNDTIVITGKDRTTTENTASLSTTIIGSLSAKFSFQVRHNSDPPADTKRTDTLSKVSLTYDF